VAKILREPEILIFDVDGVLVDVRETYWRSALLTVRQLSGKRVTLRELHERKSKPGNNDDWAMTSAWLTSLGRPTTYDQARRAFEKLYWGTGEKPGLVANEKLLIAPAQIARWAKRYELNLFTGRTRREFSFTFRKWPGTKHFETVITMDDARPKPHPEGLLKILRGRDPRAALYVGDNIDDALAARGAGVPFVAVLARDQAPYRRRAKLFRESGALALLETARDLERLLPR
jgi:HAD superfamily phosphatase